MPTGSVTPAGGAAFNGGTITRPLIIDMAGASGGLNEPMFMVIIGGTAVFAVYQETDGATLSYMPTANVGQMWHDELSAVHESIYLVDNSELILRDLPTTSPGDTGSIWVDPAAARVLKSTA